MVSSPLSMFSLMFTGLVTTYLLEKAVEAHGVGEYETNGRIPTMVGCVQNRSGLGLGLGLDKIQSTSTLLSHKG